MSRKAFSARYVLLAAGFISLASLALSARADVPAAATTVSPTTDPTADIDRSIDLPVTQIGQPLPRVECLVLNITTRPSGDGAIVSMNVPGTGRQAFTSPPDGKASADELQEIINHSPRAADHGARILLVVGTDVRFSALAPVLIDCVVGRAHEFNFITRTPDGTSLQMLSAPIPVISADTGTPIGKYHHTRGDKTEMRVNDTPSLSIQLESVVGDRGLSLKARIGTSEFAGTDDLAKAMKQKYADFTKQGVKPNAVQVTVFPKSDTRYDQIIAVCEIVLEAGFDHLGFGMQE